MLNRFFTSKKMLLLLLLTCYVQETRPMSAILNIIPGISLVIKTVAFISTYYPYAPAAISATTGGLIMLRRWLNSRIDVFERKVDDHFKSVDITLISLLKNQQQHGEKLDEITCSLSKHQNNTLDWHNANLECQEKSKLLLMQKIQGETKALVEIIASNGALTNSNISELKDQVAEVKLNLQALIRKLDILQLENISQSIAAIDGKDQTIISNKKIGTSILESTGPSNDSPSDLIVKTLHIIVTCSPAKGRGRGNFATKIFNSVGKR